jgi:hypothetical protein
MTRATRLTSSTLALAAAGAAAVWAWPREVHAVRPEPFEAWLAETRSFHTLYQSGLQVDVDQEIVTLDYQSPEGWFSQLRVHWDGTDVWVARPDQPAERLPPAVGAKARQAWDEWRAGLPQATVTEEPIVSHIPGFAGYRYRVHVPWDWASGYDLLVETGFTGAQGSAVVVHAGTLDVVRLPIDVPRNGYAPKVEETTRPMVGLSLGSPLQALDVPLAPSTYAPELAPPGDLAFQQAPYAYPWHVRQQFVRLVHDRDTADRGAVTAACPTAGALTTDHGLHRFRMPADPHWTELAELAAQECEHPTFFVAAAARFAARAGQQACVDAVLRVVDTSTQPPETLLVRDLERCRTGPSADQVPLRVEVPLPAGRDLSGLEVVLEGDAAIRCLAKGAAQGSATFGTEEHGEPVLRWYGCLPGWPHTPRGLVPPTTTEPLLRPM